MEISANEEIIDCGENITLKISKEDNKYKIIIQDDSNEIDNKLIYYKNNNGEIVFNELNIGQPIKNCIMTSRFIKFEIGNKKIHINHNNETMTVKNIIRNNNVNNNNIINHDNNNNINDFINNYFDNINENIINEIFINRITRKL